MDFSSVFALPRPTVFRVAQGADVFYHESWPYRTYRLTTELSEFGILSQSETVENSQQISSLTRLEFQLEVEADKYGKSLGDILLSSLYVVKDETFEIAGRVSEANYSISATLETTIPFSSPSFLHSASALIPYLALAHALTNSFLHYLFNNSNFTTNMSTSTVNPYLSEGERRSDPPREPSFTAHFLRHSLEQQPLTGVRGAIFRYRFGFFSLFHVLGFTFFLAAEFAGTMVLVLFGTGSLAHMVLTQHPDVAGNLKGDWLSVAFGFASGIALGNYIAGSISGGHLNPAVTAALETYRGFLWKKGPIYWFAQTMGAFIGSAIIYGNYFHAINV
ncbi:aquaporin-like protein [Mycena epipterygia]|nr:aquaporin-like protein [Mycena epipterygia]